MLMLSAKAIFFLCKIIPLSHALSVPKKPSSPFANLSPIAFGTLNPSYDETPIGLANILNALPKGTLIDTAEKYGTNDGDAETELGRALKISTRSYQCSSDYGDGDDATTDNSNTPDLLLCSKFAPKPWRLTPDSVVEACKASLSRLGVDQLYLYQLHYSDAVSQPFKLFGYTDNKDEIYWEGLAQCYHQGLVKYIGVANYGPNNVHAAYDYFTQQNVPLVSNQINFNLMRYRSSLETKRVCDELGIQTIGYHPLGAGVLTGAYDKEWFSNVPSGLNQKRSKATRVLWYQKNCQPVINAVKDVAERRGKSPAQVAINWCVCKGSIPLCGARNVEQVLEAVGGMREEDGEDWRLTESEVKELDEASDASAEYARGFELI